MCSPRFYCLEDACLFEIVMPFPRLTRFDVVFCLNCFPFVFCVLMLLACVYVELVSLVFGCCVIVWLCLFSCCFPKCFMRFDVVGLCLILFPLVLCVVMLLFPVLFVLLLFVRLVLCCYFLVLRVLMLLVCFVCIVFPVLCVLLFFVVLCFSPCFICFDVLCLCFLLC